jgi:hypothetical protein
MRSIALSITLIALAAMVVLNPVVVLLVTGLRGLAIYTAWLDLWLVLIALAALLHLRHGRPAWLWASVALIVALVPALAAGEIGYSLVRHKYGDRLLGRLADIHQPDPLLVTP